MKYLLHKIVAIPVVNDFSQRLVGGTKLAKIFADEISVLPDRGKVIDIGGGTGLYRKLFNPSWKYACLDPDPEKLEGFRAKYPADLAIEGSACEIPCGEDQFDCCLIIFVAHHLTDDELKKALGEVGRVLAPGGLLMLCDPLWVSANLRGRVTLVHGPRKPSAHPRVPENFCAATPGCCAGAKLEDSP